MKNVKEIISKEFARVFKDRKLVFSLFILPAVLMIVIYSVMGNLFKSFNNDVEEHISNVYVQNAPAEVKTVIDTCGFLETAKVEYLDGTENRNIEMEAAVLNGAADLYVVFEDNFEEKIAAFEATKVNPTITIHFNSTEDYSSIARNRFSSMVLEGYKTAVVANRVGNLDKLVVFNQEYIRNEKEEKAAGQILGMLVPYLITFLIFASAMSVVTDAIAGEKERGTMARMLMTPVKRSELAIGKIIALSGLAMLSAIVYAASMLIAVPNFAEGIYGGDMEVSVKFGANQVIMLIFLLVALAYLYVSLLAGVSIVAKDVKTASTLVSPLYVIVMLGGMITMFSTSTEVALYKYAIPVYGTALAVQKLMVNELGIVPFLVSFGATFVLGGIFTALVTKAFNSEKIMFNA